MSWRCGAGILLPLDRDRERERERGVPTLLPSGVVPSADVDSGVTDRLPSVKLPSPPCAPVGAGEEGEEGGRGGGRGRE